MSLLCAFSPHDSIRFTIVYMFLYTTGGKYPCAHVFYIANLSISLKNACSFVYTKYVQHVVLCMYNMYMHSICVSYVFAAYTSSRVRVFMFTFVSHLHLIYFSLHVPDDSLTFSHRWLVSTPFCTCLHTYTSIYISLTIPSVNKSFSFCVFILIIIVNFGNKAKDDRKRW